MNTPYIQKPAFLLYKHRIQIAAYAKKCYCTFCFMASGCCTYVRHEFSNSQKKPDRLKVVFGCLLVSTQFAFIFILFSCMFWDAQSKLTLRLCAFIRNTCIQLKKAINHSPSFCKPFGFYNHCDHDEALTAEFSISTVSF